ncbi:MAG: hypothetical protein JETCAE03_35060 [Ignavibacteriaceae bacterium]|nr:MAG: hypothetical protein JETCAE03_35060 [Ignavibacteriaceae bacterium]
MHLNIFIGKLVIKIEVNFASSDQNKNENNIKSPADIRYSFNIAYYSPVNAELV